MPDPLSIDKAMRAMQDELPPEKRSARAALKLANWSRAKNRKLRGQVSLGHIGKGMSEEDRTRLFKDLNGHEKRITFYISQMKGLKPAAPWPESVNPLFHTTPGKGHFTPDALTPLMLSHTIDELEQHAVDLQADLVRFLGEAMRNVPKVIWEKGKEAADAVLPDIPTGRNVAIGVGIGVGVVFVAGVGYVLVKRRAS